jgi:hypothetical protein
MIPRPFFIILMAVPCLLRADDKGSYSLFHPTPRDQMREMSTDRPDTTESPYTVDAGHWQLEMSFFDYSRDHADGIRSQAWGFGLVNLKAGLWNHTDFQMIFDSYTREKSTGAHISERASGFSDVTLRLKTNLWGDDGGDTALAVMPYLKIPTGTDLSNDEWEGGLIVPLGIALNDRVGLGLMAEVDVVHDEDTGGHEWEFLHSATAGFGLTEQLGLYVELVGIAGPETDYQALFDTGLTFSVTDNLVFDAGIRLGLNDAAEDFGVFAGMSIRY